LSTWDDAGILRWFSSLEAVPDTGIRKAND
jgi:hypothetical protein